MTRFFNFLVNFMANDTNLGLDQYKQLQNDLEDRLRRSSTAYTRGAEPTSSDLRADLQLKKIRESRSEAYSESQADKWYSDDRAEAKTERDEGALMKGLNALGLPLYGIVGGVEAILGKGTKPGLANVIENIRERETFGDLLRKYDVPELASLPIGLALDIAFDPVNWLTAGTAATIPKLVKGAQVAKGAGLKAAAKAATLQKASTLSKITPVFRKSDTAQKIIKKSADAAYDYNKTIGRDVISILEKQKGRGMHGLPKIGKIIEDRLGQSERGQKIVDFFKYSNTDWFRGQLAYSKAVAKDAAKGDIMLSGSSIGRKELRRAITEQLLDGADFSLAEIEDLSKAISDEGMVGFYRKHFEKINMEGAAIATVLSDVAQTAGGSQMNLRLAGEAATDEKTRRILFNLADKLEDKTGWNLFDVAGEKFRDITVGDVNLGEKIANGYRGYIDMFKYMKVPLNPAAWTNAIVGNVTMGWMAGLDVWDPKYKKQLYNAFKIMKKNPDPMSLATLLDDPEWSRVMQESPELIKGMFGLDTAFLFDKNPHLTIIESAVKNGKIKAGELTDDALREMELLVENGRKKMLDNIDNGLKRKNARLMGSSASQVIKDGGKKGQLAASTFSGELYQSEFRKIVNGLEEAAERGNPAAKAAHWWFTKPMEGYDLIDRSNKLGTAMVASKIGLSEGELMKIKNFIDIGANDILPRDAATGLYKLTVEKSVELAGEIYMNYGAMPGAVKVLRSLPFMGAPFASFMYAMGTKAGKTLVHNPAIFNKMNFAMQEISGKESPLEKLALDQPYYSWYKRGGMVKLPFFQDNPVYMNVANMIPYYTMNMLQPSERKYDRTLPKVIAGIFDKTPLMKTPEGQILFDYFVQPMLLRETNPRGMFDQLLWPTDASNASKAGYMLRSAAESVIPAGIGALGGIPGGMLPDEFIKFLPSYRWRQIANATKGKTPQGVNTREPAFQKTLRGLSASLGIPVYPLKLDYVASEAKKKLNQ